MSRHLRPPSARALTAWLVDGGLAVEHNGLLHPTRRAVEFGEALAPFACPTGGRNSPAPAGEPDRLLGLHEVGLLDHGALGRHGAEVPVHVKNAQPQSVSTAATPSISLARAALGAHAPHRARGVHKPDRAEYRVWRRRCRGSVGIPSSGGSSWPCLGVRARLPAVRAGAAARARRALEGARDLGVASRAVGPAAADKTAALRAG